MGGAAPVSFERSSAAEMAFMLEATVAEIVERGHAVGLGPDADRTAAADARVLEVDVGLAVQRHLDALARELHAQRVPGVPRYRCVDVLDRDAPAVRGVIERDVVLQRIAARDVVFLAVLPAPDHAPRLVFPAGCRLEADFDEAVLDRSGGQHAPWECAGRRLLQ